jgi:hypothetical protein
MTNLFSSSCSMQSMERKLRIFPGPDHPFAQAGDVVPFEMRPRKLREKGDLLVLPEGFQPFNKEAYEKRYGHRLVKLAVKQAAGEGAVPGAVPTQ